MKVDIDKFKGSGDFHIWRRKVKGLLVQQKLLNDLDDPLTLPDDYTEDQKQELLETTTGIIILHLIDAIICFVDKEDTPAKIWKRLDELFQKTSVTNKIFFKERLFGYKMNTTKGLEQNLDSS